MSNIKPERNRYPSSLLTWNHKATIKTFLNQTSYSIAKSKSSHPDVNILSHNAQDTKTMDGHSKSYCTRPFNCVKCGGPHGTTTCKKIWDTPAKCVLCNGNHPANYKGCTVYRDLINSRNKDNPRKNINPRTTHKLCLSHHKLCTNNYWKTTDSTHK